MNTNKSDNITAIQFEFFPVQRSDFVQQVTSHKKLSVFATPGRHTFLIPINRGFEVIDLLFFLWRGLEFMLW